MWQNADIWKKVCVTRRVAFWSDSVFWIPFVSGGNHMRQLQDVHPFQRVEPLNWNTTKRLLQILFSTACLMFMSKGTPHTSFMTHRLAHHQQQQCAQTDPRRVSAKRAFKCVNQEDAVEAHFLPSAQCCSYVEVCLYCWGKRNAYSVSKAKWLRNTQGSSGAGPRLAVWVAHRVISSCCSIIGSAVSTQSEANYLVCEYLSWTSVKGAVNVMFFTMDSNQKQKPHQALPRRLHFPQKRAWRGNQIPEYWIPKAPWRLSPTD